MKVIIDGESLHMEPESEKDQQTLELIFAKFDMDGFGRSPETGKIVHMQIPLREVAY